MRIGRSAMFSLPLFVAMAPAAVAAPPSLRLPLACTPGKSCFVQQYFDHDPGPGAKDYRCGSRVYDGHDGTDIRLPSVAAQRRGVPVFAAADGLVTGVRDGVADHLVATAADRTAIAGKECGNGVVITHEDGWETQYCHMARGSIAVMLGRRVKAGDRLGLVGLSGDTQFPHLHFAVRQGKRKVDPFAPDAPAGTCAPAGGNMLWTPEAAQALYYRSTEILNLGFADGPVEMDAIEEETLGQPNAMSDALVVYGRAIGLKAGDRLRLAFIDPKGASLIERETVIDTDKAQYMLFSGERRPAEGWGRGRYRLSVTVSRAGQTVASANAILTL